MKSIRIALALVLFVPGAFAQKREILELSRDMNQVQQDLRALQSSQDSRLGALQTQVQQALDAITRLNASLAVLGNNVDNSLKGVGAPVANLSGKLDTFQQNFSDLRDTVADLSARMGKLDAKITDLQNSIQLGGSRPSPPASGAGGGPTAGMPPATGGPPPNMSADTTYSSAYRDYQGGNLDLALQEFTTYLQYFPTTQLAPNAQYYVGDIYYQKGDYEDAVKAFDAVNEKFGDNNKTASAHFMKGRAMVKLGHRDAAAKEFREVATRAADPDLVAKAKAQLREMGLSTGAPAARRRR